MSLSIVAICLLSHLLRHVVRLLGVELGKLVALRLDAHVDGLDPTLDFTIIIIAIIAIMSLYHYH